MRYFGINPARIMAVVGETPAAEAPPAVPVTPAAQITPTMPAVPATAPPVTLTPEALQTLMQQRGGGADPLAATLYSQVQQLQQQLAAAQGQVPAAGAVVLSTEDAATFAQLQASGVPLGEIPGRIAKANAADRTDALTAAATAAGYTGGGAALGYAVGDLPVTVQTEGEGEAAKQVAYVTPEAGKPPVELTAWITANRAALLPSLQVAATAPGTPFVQQPVGGQPAKTDWLGQQIKARNEAVSKPTTQAPVRAAV